MPEALAAMPALNLPTGYSSETDTPPITDRSSSSSSAANANDGVAAANTATAASTSESAARKKQQLPQQQNGGGQHKRTRRSTGRRGGQKKPALKLSTPQKTAAALNLKSQIPRALLLSPSSSTTSLSTSSATAANDVSAPATPRLPEPPVRETRCLQLVQRQQSVAILNFRLQKSISQMDLKRSRRNGGNYQLSSSPRRGGIGGGGGGSSITVTETLDNASKAMENASKALVPNNGANVAAASASRASLMQKMFQQDDYYYMMQQQQQQQERDPKMAGMRIFATIMLNAWRKRRGEVKRLMEEVNDLKKGSIKAKNQLHVFNTLFRVEQRRNDELNCQLKRSMEDINNTKSSCESLTTSLISLKADKALLEQQLEIKDQEYDGLNTILTQTKSDLFKAMTQQRELQANLSMEQRKVQMLENQKNDLINEICEMNNDALQKEEKLRTELEKKEADLNEAASEMKLIQELLMDFNDKEAQLRLFVESDGRLKSEIKDLRSEVDQLRQCLESTLGYRLKTCWNNTMVYQKTTFQMLHWVAFYMLPATPPPKVTSFPFGLTLEKVLSVVKR